MKKLKNNSKSKKAIVYESLKSRTINNLIKPGEPLNEGTLSKEFKISKTPIREALQQLEREGFVENIPVKGAFISRISFQDIRELFEIREILECEAIKRAVTKVDSAKIKLVKEEFVSSESEGGKTDKSHFRSGDQIHTFIFETLGNHRLMEIYKRLQDHVVRNRIYFFDQSHLGRSEEALKEHLEILDAMEAQDPLRAEQAVRDHLRNSMEYLKKIM
ncbi:MAG: GntR family transcriptional regulator [Deltaproteobacteria bacterium]|nr:GntR family transcriptional regulator [Deltaproteobacteria bacterium]MBM4322703.1 GntR family transcriptional regulator [Deltaproteobacteria bacterium]MBM4347386.1 GntR family transcriptional regulator [Deltaproteobacteria bacterium]